VKLGQIAAEIGARVVTRADPAAVEIERVYAGDRISALLEEAAEGTLLVTNLVGAPLVRVATLMDVPAICLLNGLVPELAFVEAAETHGVAVLVAPAGMFETCGRLYAALVRGQGGKR
jgi:hypothetical protein